jgi:hypothetical protein
MWQRDVNEPNDGSGPPRRALLIFTDVGGQKMGARCTWGAMANGESIALAVVFRSWARLVQARRRILEVTAARLL